MSGRFSRSSLGAFRVGSRAYMLRKSGRQQPLMQASQASDGWSDSSTGSKSGNDDDNDSQLILTRPVEIPLGPS